MKDSFLNNLISKLDSLDASNMQAFILRLVKQKGFLETVFNTIKEGIIVIDRYLKIQYANKSAIDLLGFPENYEEQNISKFLRDIDWKRILQADEQEWYRISRQEIKVFYPRRRILNFYIVPHGGQEEELATIMINDLTETRENDMEYFESEKVRLISLLAASVAHEIGNPLNSLSIHLRLLEKLLKGKTKSKKEALDAINISKNEVKRLDMIITQFLHAIRPAKPTMEVIDIKEVVSQTLAFLENELKDRSIKVISRWPDVIPDIMGDHNQIKQAIFNIIKNSIQAISKGGKITIKCNMTEEYLNLSISDTGCGISAKDMNNIFEPFYSTKKTGVGLGLMIVEKIIREHGAELILESDRGKGTIFTIKFPLNTNKMRLLNAPGYIEKKSKDKK